VGETLKISLSSTNINGKNELYVRYGGIPIRNLYDFVYGDAGKPNQFIVIPVLQKGTYYLMAYGTAAISLQNVTLLARKINFEVQSVTANQGGNTGTVTVKILGAKFEQGMQVELYGDGLPTISAYSIKNLSSTSLFASFNLSGKQLGLYNLRLVKQDLKTASLTSAFRVVAGTGGGAIGGGSGGGFFCTITNAGVDGELGLDISMPEYMRVGAVIPITINYGNTSNVDIPLPTKLFISVDKVPVGFSKDELKEGKVELFIQCKEVGGPDNVLRPGAVGTITVYAEAVRALVVPHQILNFKLY
jgi:hypothetical protein